MRTGSEIVRSQEETGNDWRTAKTALLTRSSPQISLTASPARRRSVSGRCFRSEVVLRVRDTRQAEGACCRAQWLALLNGTRFVGDLLSRRRLNETV
jgi:hypothetical protein